MYEVIGKDGNTYGPLDMAALQDWAASNRLTPEMMVRDPISGHTLRAAEMLAGQGIFPPRAENNEAPLAAQSATLLGKRLGAFILDLLISIPLQIASCVPILGILFAPLLCLYWLSLDSFFGGQSVGKKMMGLRVICLDGSAFTWSHSAKRHFLAWLILFEMIPIFGVLIGAPLTVIGGIVEIVLIVITGRRLGDRFANTQVVSDR